MFICQTRPAKTHACTHISNTLYSCIHKYVWTHTHWEESVWGPFTLYVLFHQESYKIQKTKQLAHLLPTPRGWWMLSCGWSGLMGWASSCGRGQVIWRWLLQTGQDNNNTTYFTLTCMCLWYVCVCASLCHCSKWSHPCTVTVPAGQVCVFVPE